MKNNFDTKKLTMYAILTAIVVILQYMGSFIKFGTFSISLVLVPIVIGAALYGPKLGAWLGFVFSGMVFVTGDAALFLGINYWGTIITVILKGTLAGLATGLVYNWLKKINTDVAVIVSAIVCPLVNTGIFAIGCFTFFMDWVTQTAAGAQSAVSFVFLTLIGLNFLLELLVNVILSPVIVRLLKIRKA
ncbi:MAG: ECF transporter S component [Clostridia bacterium]|nr:ECF transporter S component [Clostridia bacterium]MBQ4543824.1 ECF transporter S component [Clostridia bacterium]MBQ9997635.1 ECF transporter S component [Clostridia bacterium]